MVQFVVQKKFKKPSADQSLNVAHKVGWVVRRIPIKFFWIFFGLFVLIYWVFLLLKNTIFASEYLIKKVDYSLSSVVQYDNPYLYKKISTLLKWENYYVTAWNKSDILESVQTEFPFVSDILMVYKPVNAMIVKVLFDKPDFLFIYEDHKFGVYKSNLFEIYSGNTIWSGLIKINVVSFFSWLSMLTGIFYKYPADKLLADVQLLKQGFSRIESLSYIPGWSRIIVNLDKWIKVYINTMVDIQKQIKNYQLLKKYYSDFALLKEIDLGSLESDKVIVKK